MNPRGDGWYGFNIILYPITIAQCHWALVVVCTNGKCIRCHDSDVGNGNLNQCTPKPFVRDHGDGNEW